MAKAGTHPAPQRCMLTMFELPANVCVLAGAALACAPKVYEGAFHGAEVPFVFGDQFELTTEVERAASRAMGCWWTNFAATGNPNLGNAAGLQRTLPLAVLTVPLPKGCVCPCPAAYTVTALALCVCVLCQVCNALPWVSMGARCQA